MPSPSQALGTLRPDLSRSFEEFSLEANQAGFIGLRVLPGVPVAKQSGIFGKIPVAQLLKNRDTLRAPGAHYARSGFTFGKATFACIEYGAEDPVDDSEATAYSDFFPADDLAAARALHDVLMGQEKRITAAVFNATTWTGSALTTGITHEWDDATNAVPITDVLAAKKRVFAGSGLWPNALVINRKVFMNLQQVAQIVDRVKYAGFTDPLTRGITVPALAQAFDLDYILVAGGAKNTAIEGQSVAISPVWSDEYAMVCKVASTRDPREPCIGRSFQWTEDADVVATVEAYREESTRSDIYRARQNVDEVIIYAAAGHLLSNVTT